LLQHNEEGDESFVAITFFSFFLLHCRRWWQKNEEKKNK
jgi:hypothetical protein